MFDDAEHRKGAAVGDLMYASLVGNNETESVSSLAPPPLRIMAGIRPRGSGPRLGHLSRVYHNHNLWGI